MARAGELERIMAAMEAGHFVRAARLCRRQLDDAPDDPEVLQLLGLALQRQDRAGDAVDLYRRLTELRPDDAVQWGNLATALRAAGDAHAAEHAARQAVRLAPGDAGQLERLGLLQSDLGEWTAARDTLITACAAASGSAAIRIRAARACIVCRDSRAEDLLAPWREWLPLDDPLQFELGETLAQMSEMRSAVMVLDDLLRRSPDNVPAQLLLAKSCERINDLGRARALLQQLEARGAEVDNGVRREIMRQRAQLAARDRRFDTARKLLEQLGEDDAGDYGHYYALAHACDRLGDRAAAMAALDIAHARQSGEIRKYAPELLAPDATPLPHADDRVTADDYRAWPHLKAPGAAQSPVFVVGFPRSGTTLLEQMLDAHPRLQSMDERPFFTQLAQQLEGVGIEVPRDLGKLTQRDCDELRKGYLLMGCGKVHRDWDTRLVDKNPLNMLWLPMVHRLFPAANFIFALRHPCDVVLSCYLQNFRAWPLAAASRTLEALARAYVTAMQSWVHHVGVLEPRVLVSRYEDLVADPAAHARRIAEFLDLEDAPSLLNFMERAREKGFIATPSYAQVIEPISARSVNHWRAYQRWFDPVVPILAPMLRYWGYA